MQRLHQLDAGYRNLGVERHRHLPDVDHLGDLRHLGHRHQPDEDHQVGSGLGDPCPAKVRMGYCLDVLPGEECPCPDLKRMGCCLGEECRQPVKEDLVLEQRRLALQLLAPQLALRQQALQPCLALVQPVLQVQQSLARQLPLP